MLLPDINFWLALAFESHVFHLSAKAKFEGWVDEPGLFCRSTQQGFLRLATNPKAFGEEAVTLAEAWQLYDALLADPLVSFVHEPGGVESLWRDYTQGRTFSRKIWNDAYLAAFARAGDYEVLTFDQGFTQFKNLHYTILS